MENEIKNTLLETLKFYKQNFFKLIGYATTMFMYSQLMTMYGYYISKYINSALVVCLMSLCMLIAMIIFIIVIPKISMAVQILINELLSNKDMGLREAYKKTKGKYWKYVRYIILMMICMIPYFILMAYKIPYANIIGKLYIMFTIPFFYIAEPIVSIEGKSNKYLTKPFKLIKGHYFYIVIVYFLTVIIFSLPHSICIYFFKDQLTIFLLGTINNIIHFITLPLAEITEVIVYKKLTNKLHEKNN